MNETAADHVTAISSMATRQLLAALGEACEQRGGLSIRLESVGGVDAARRVRDGESFDLVVLAAEAIDALLAAGHVIAGSCRPIAVSSVAIAVRAGVDPPDVASEEALRRAVLSARRIGYSTGPSGTALLKLFARWGLDACFHERLVQARAGTPVAALLASGQADFGFQQFSELKDEAGVTLLGPMPPGLEIATTFVCAIGAGSSRAAEAAAVLDFMASPAADGTRQRYGMARAETSESLA